MGKNIIILNGSPRINGNTSALTAAFKRGAEEAGNTVKEFHLSRMKINGCLGCWHGGKNPRCGRAGLSAVLLVHLGLLEKRF